MKKFLSIFKIICSFSLLLNIFFLFVGIIFAIMSINYGSTKYLIKLLIIFIASIFLLILFFKNNPNKKDTKKIIFLGIFIIIFYTIFIIPEIGISILKYLLISIIFIYIFLFLNSISFKNKDIEK